MPRALLTLAAIGLTVFAAADCYSSPRYRLVGAPRWLWMVLIILLPLMGPILWLIVSRNAKRPAPIAPDDDPDFLRFLENRTRRATYGQEAGEGEDGPEESESSDDPGEGEASSGSSK
ncbi:hypothetical protein GCM10010401_04570 [Rarobacter faecitabidus]|uniref:Phospholipase D-like protein n=1 Tax=Rarobacter faecitabidus TaxID=13243 RepID=A0A542ZTV3_RARFA|nr:PLD nuclease N-terminal domain-containing protein [Rarobacter faecitabidus]TQL63788.1 phospholipase D-like protein [Rarobacter faecitabidus]